MKIFGIPFETRKELKNKIINLMIELDNKIEAFPFDLGQTVYDVAYKNAKVKYTKTKPSFEYSTITEVTVTENNYFSLVKRLARGDVFFSYEAAEHFLKYVCGE